MTQAPDAVTAPVAKPKPKRLWLWAPWIGFLVVVLGWVGWWMTLSGAANQAVTDWVAEQTAAGASVTIPTRTTSGFPLRLELKLSDVAYSPPDRSYTATASALDVLVNPTAPHHVILRPAGPITLATADGRTRTLLADNALMSLRSQRQVLARGSLEANGISISEAGRPTTTLLRLVAHIRPDPRAAGRYQLALEARDWDMGQPVTAFEGFGQRISLMQAQIVIDKAAALITSPGADPLEAWRAAGGSLTVEAAQAQWGALKVNARGQGGLDAERRISGALELDLPEPGPALSALGQSPALSGDAKRTLGLLGLAAGLSGKALQTNMTARDGTLRVGDAPVRGLPPVY